MILTKTDKKKKKKVGVDEDKAVNLNSLREGELVREWGLQTCMNSRDIFWKIKALLVSFEFD